MNFPLTSKKEKRAAIKKLSRLERKRTVEENPDVVLLTASIPDLTGLTKKEKEEERMKARRAEFKMRRAWVTCLYDCLKNTEFFDDGTMTWYEIEEVTTKSRVTWVKCMRSSWEYDVKRWATRIGKDGKKEKYPYLYTGPTEPISDHFIADVTSALRQEGFTVFTREFVDLVVQGLSVQEDPSIFTAELGEWWGEKDEERKRGLEVKAKEAWDNGGDVLYYAMTKTHPEEWDMEDFGTFPMLHFGNSAEQLRRAAECVETWSLEFEACVFPDDLTKGRMTERVNKRKEAERFKEDQERIRREEFEEKIAEKQRYNKAPRTGMTPSATRVGVAVPPNGGWLEDIEVTQRIHPSMLDKDGRFTLTVSVQYHNVGTEENPEWVKTSENYMASNAKS